jgi:purine-binding chemotaxis protein CheW
VKDHEMSDEAFISWDEVRKRMGELRDKAASGDFKSPEDRKRILAGRARDLSRVPEEPANARDLVEIVEFELAGEHYGFEVGYVREISVLKDLVPVPGTPSFVIGVINVRGEIHTVIDLKKFFDLPEKGITELNTVLIVEGDEMRLGVLADGICDVRAIRREALHPSLPMLTGIRAEYLKGVTNERLIVLDASRILSDDSIIVRHESGA